MQRNLFSLARSGVIAFGAFAGVCMPATADSLRGPSFNFPMATNVNDDQTCANALDCTSNQSGFQSAVLIRQTGDAASLSQDIAWIPHGGGFGGWHGGGFGGWHGGGFGGWHGGGFGWRGGGVGWHGFGGGWNGGWHGRRYWRGGGGWGWGWGALALPLFPYYDDLYDYYDYGPDYYTPYYYPPRYRVGLPNAHVAWCEHRYRSYRASDNTFQPNRGPRQQCISPIG